MQIDAGAGVIIKRLEEAGYEAYVVGGCVRDALMGLEPKDWDITTSAKPEEVKELFAKTFDTGIEHGTVSVWSGQAAYEVTTYRIDGVYTDHRRPDEVQYTSLLYEDLARRDFTINAMAYHPEKGLVDYFEGQQDLKAGRIRCVGKPEERFEEDALRMLRAIRFAARLQFVIEPETFKAIQRKAAGLAHVSKERVADEVNQTLLCQEPIGLNKIVESGLANWICQEFGSGEQLDFEAPAKTSKNRALRWAALLYPMGARRADHVFQELKFDNATRKAAGCLLSFLKEDLPKTESEMRHLMYRMGASYILPLCELKLAAGVNEEAQLEDMRALYEQEKESCVTLAQLAVSGRDLIAAGAQPGKALGAALEDLLEQVLENPELNQKEQLITLFQAKSQA